MPADDGFKFPEDFLLRIDEPDDHFLEELQKLTTEQRSQLADMVMEERAKRARLN